MQRRVDSSGFLREPTVWDQPLPQGRTRQCLRLPSHVRRMRRKAERNATGLARRFSSLAGLKLLLADELRASALARARAMDAFEELSQACRHRPDTLVEQVP